MYPKRCTCSAVEPLRSCASLCIPTPHLRRRRASRITSAVFSLASRLPNSRGAGAAAGKFAQSAVGLLPDTLARKLIEDNQDKMHAMAKALLEWETIDTDQLDDIMAGKDPRPPKDWTPRTPNSGGGGGSGGAPAVAVDPSPTVA